MSPLTWRGSIHVIAWLCGLAVITIVGSLLVNWPTLVWFGIALAVMGAVASWWDRRRPAVDD